MTQNTTFGRFEYFESMQEPNESVERFYSRLREPESPRKFDRLEENLVKHLFLSNI